MKRGWSVFWVVLMIAVAVVTYAMKDSAGRAADHVMELRAAIAREKDQMTVLRAEWGVLDQPSRLQSLVDRYNNYLNLKPLDVRQLASIADIPAKPAVPLEASLDGLRTGSIGQPARPTLEAAARPKIARPATPRRSAPAIPKPAAPAQPETGYLE